MSGTWHFFHGAHRGQGLHFGRRRHPVSLLAFNPHPGVTLKDS